MKTRWTTASTAPTRSARMLRQLLPDDADVAGLLALNPPADEPILATYSYLASARLTYDEAVALTDNDVEREFLTSRRAALD